MPDKRTKSNAPCEILALLSNELLSVGIPSRPVVLASIEKEMLSSAPCYGTLEKIISIDVGLSASLLKIANSAFFGCSGHVRSVDLPDFFGPFIPGKRLPVSWLKDTSS